MKFLKEFKLKTIIFPISVLLTLLNCSSNTQNKSQRVIKVAISINDSIPLLLLGSFNKPNDNISYQTIKERLEEGTIYCTADIKEIIKRRFNLQK